MTLPKARRDRMAEGGGLADWDAGERKRGVLRLSGVLAAAVIMSGCSAPIDDLMSRIEAARAAEPGPTGLDVTRLVDAALADKATEAATTAYLTQQGFRIVDVARANDIAAFCGDADRLIVATQRLNGGMAGVYDEATITLCIKGGASARMEAKIFRRSI